MASKNPREYPSYPEHYARFRAKGFDNDVPVQFIVYCPNCGSDWLIKASKNADNEQRMQCKRCSYRFHFAAHRRESAIILCILILINKGYSYKMIAKEMDIHTSTVSKYVEKYLPIIKYLLTDNANKLE